MEEKFNRYLKVENEMVFEGKFSQYGFIDKTIKDRFDKSKSDWENATHRHNEFLKWGIDAFIKNQ